MANEGIMALPQGMDMQGESAQQQPAQQRPTVSSADSYDATLTALNMTDPQQFDMFKQQLRQTFAGIEIPAQELSTLINILERLVETPEDYPEFARLAQADGIEVPDEFDPEFVGALLVVFNEMQMQVSETLQDMTNVGPTMEGMEPARFAKGGLADVAQYLQSQGRGGDTVLAHITPGEASMLQRQGGAGTINPATGLREYGWLSKAWKSVTGAVKSVVKGVVNVVKDVVKSPVGRILATVGLTMLLGPAALGLSMGTAAGLASAGVTLAGGGSIKEALISGAMGYFGGGGTIMGTSPLATIGGYLPGAAGSALNTGLATGLTGFGIGKLGGMSTQDALKMGLISGASAAGTAALRAPGTPATPGSEAAPTTPGADGSVPAVQAPGSIGTTGTAQDLLASNSPYGLKAPSMAPSMSYDPTTGSYKAGYDIYAGSSPAPVAEMGGATGLRGGFSGAGTTPGATPGPSMTGAAGMVDAMGTGVRSAPNYGGADFSMAAGGRGLATNYGLTPSPTTTATAPTGFFDKVTTGAKDLYNEYLSPDRPGLPSDAGILRRYAPLAAAGTAAVGALGGMNSEPVNQNPAFNRSYTGTDYMRDNPDRFSGGLSTYTRPENPSSSIVPAPSYGYIPLGSPGAVNPYGITQRPGGSVAQPYNTAGLYDVPMIYGPDGRLVRAAAKGGAMKTTQFPRRNGPISGPGTGTSDDIPAMLSDGEFVFTAKAVRNAGNGSRRKGAARMYKLMKKLEGGAVKGN